VSKPRLVWELQNGLPYQTWPRGIVIEIDWHDLYVLEHLDVPAGGLTKFVPGPRVPPILADRQIDVAIEVLWPPERPADPPLADAPAASPAAPRAVTSAALRRAVLKFAEEHSAGGPLLAEGALHEELERRLGAKFGRDRLRQALKDYAPQLKLDVGKPRKKA
jgi:hypothetical protein